jgi:hypothetical protein
MQFISAASSRIYKSSAVFCNAYFSEMVKFKCGHLKVGLVGRKIKIFASMTSAYIQDYNFKTVRQENGSHLLCSLHRQCKACSNVGSKGSLRKRAK